MRKKKPRLPALAPATVTRPCAICGVACSLDASAYRPDLPVVCGPHAQAIHDWLARASSPPVPPVARAPRCDDGWPAVPSVLSDFDRVSVREVKVRWKVAGGAGVGLALAALLGGGKSYGLARGGSGSSISGFGLLAGPLGLLGALAGALGGD